MLSNGLKLKIVNGDFHLNGIGIKMTFKYNFLPSKVRM